MQCSQPDLNPSFHSMECCIALYLTTQGQLFLQACWAWKTFLMEIRNCLQGLQSDEKVFIVMEYMAGGNLYNYVISRKSTPEEWTRWFFQQVVVAIDYCHRKVCLKLFLNIVYTMRNRNWIKLSNN